MKFILHLNLSIKLCKLAISMLPKNYLQIHQFFVLNPARNLREKTPKGLPAIFYVLHLIHVYLLKPSKTIIKLGSWSKVSSHRTTASSPQLLPQRCDKKLLVLFTISVHCMHPLVAAWDEDVVMDWWSHGVAARHIRLCDGMILAVIKSSRYMWERCI